MQKLNHLTVIMATLSLLSCSNPAEKIGAYQMPYIRYDSQEAQLGGKAVRETAFDFDRTKTASEASNQEYAALTTTADFVAWKINNSANGVTLRFTLPDNAEGESIGRQSEIDIFVNGEKVKTVELNSRWAWQYFEDKVSDPLATVTPYAMMRFDEVHFLLDRKINAGDEIKIAKRTNDSLVCGIDFIEIEEVAAPIAMPANALSVVDFGAKGDGVTDDYAAIIACIKAAHEQKKTVYFPAGTFRIDTLLKLDLDGTNLQGAGMWHTNLYFGNDGFRRAAICGNANRLRVADMYVSGLNNRRLGQKDKNGNWVYTINYGWQDRVLYQDQKGIAGNWGDSSVIENVWIEHFECGIWIAPYGWVEDKVNFYTTREGETWTNDKGEKFAVPAGLLLDLGGGEAEKPRTTNLRVSNVRLRNEYADGVNFAEGTSFSVFEHSNVRNCGDDGIASWSQHDGGAKTPPNKGNIFRYNTVELGWRAGGIGMFGGGGHRIYNCYVGEHSLAAGIRFTADFPGCPLDMDAENAMSVRNCVVYKCGTAADLFHDRLGAIDIHGRDTHDWIWGNGYPLANIAFENIEIIAPQTDGIQLWGGNIFNISFKNITIKDVKHGADIANVLDKEESRTRNKQQRGNAVFEKVTKDKVLNENADFVLRFK